MLHSQERDEIHKKKMLWFLGIWCMQMRDIVKETSGILGLIGGDEWDLHYLTRMTLLSRSCAWHAKLGRFYDYLTILLQSLNLWMYSSCYAAAFLPEFSRWKSYTLFSHEQVIKSYIQLENEIQDFACYAARQWWVGLWLYSHSRVRSWVPEGLLEGKAKESCEATVQW